MTLDCNYWGKLRINFYLYSYFNRLDNNILYIITYIFTILFYLVYNYSTSKTQVASPQINVFTSPNHQEMCSAQEEREREQSLSLITKPWDLEQAKRYRKESRTVFINYKINGCISSKSNFRSCYAVCYLAIHYPSKSDKRFFFDRLSCKYSLCGRQP